MSLTLRQRVNHAFRCINNTNLGRRFQHSAFARAIEATINGGGVEFISYHNDCIRAKDNNPLNHYRRIRALNDKEINYYPHEWTDPTTREDFIIYNHPRITRPDLSGQAGVFHPKYSGWHIFYASLGVQRLPMNFDNFSDFKPNKKYYHG